jgi:hypothetical protein
MWQIFKPRRLQLVTFVAFIALAGTAVVAYSYDNDSYGGRDRSYGMPSAMAAVAASPPMPRVTAL